MQPFFEKLLRYSISSNLSQFIPPGSIALGATVKPCFPGLLQAGSTYKKSRCRMLDQVLVQIQFPLCVIICGRGKPGRYQGREQRQPAVGLPFALTHYFHILTP